MVSFDREFREVSDNINFHSAEIDHAANAANIAESRKAREVEEANRQGEDTCAKVGVFLTILLQCPYRTTFNDGFHRRMSRMICIGISYSICLARATGC